MNIALAVFLPKRTDVLALRVFTKLRALDPALDISQFEDLPRVVRDVTAGADSVNDRLQVISRITGLTVSSRGEMLLAPNDDYDARIQRLYTRLVLPPPAPRGAQKYSRLHGEMRRRFVKEDWLSGASDEQGRAKVLEHFVLDPEQNLYAQFAMKDEALWVIETLDLRAASEQTMEKRRGQAAISRLVFEEAKAKSRKASAIAIYAAKSRDEQTASHHLKIFEASADRIFNYESKDDRNKCFDLIGAAIHHRVPAVNALSRKHFELVKLMQ